MWITQQSNGAKTGEYAGYIDFITYTIEDPNEPMFEISIL